MKITKVECIPLSVPTPMRGPSTAGNILFVKVSTDEGLVGYADAGMVSQDIVISMIKFLGTGAYRRQPSRQGVDHGEAQRCDPLCLGGVIPGGRLHD